jgi:hypothetical protein
MPFGEARFNLYSLGLGDFVYHGVPKYRKVERPPPRFQETLIGYFRS